jgi:hypothetical protein
MEDPSCDIDTLLYTLIISSMLNMSTPKKMASFKSKKVTNSYARSVLVYAQTLLRLGIAKKKF